MRSCSATANFWVLLTHVIQLVYALHNPTAAGAAAEGAARLPECEAVRTQLDLPSTSACKAGLRVLLRPAVCAHDPAEPGPRCCAQLASLLADSCHCLRAFAGPPADQLAGLHARCAAGTQRDAAIKAAAGDIRVFVGVLTAAKNAAARKAVRATWGSDPLLHRVLFFVAKPRDEALFDAVRREAAAQRDMVVLPTIWEAYFNISHQTLELCRAAALDPAVTHVAKVDDDSYLRAGRLVQRLAHLPPERTLLGWVENPGGGPHRDPANQWYVSKEEWPSERYPPWAHGAGYVLTIDLVREIAAGAALKPQQHQIFKLEDIAMGSWLEYVAQEQHWTLNLVRDKRFNFDGCQSSDIVSHYVKPHKMRCMWQFKGRCCGDRYFRGGVVGDM